jgi:hypothetical protein
LAARGTATATDGVGARSALVAATPVAGASSEGVPTVSVPVVEQPVRKARTAAHARGKIFIQGNA